MESNEFKILAKGGSMCFYGQWFGRPYDNFHRICSVDFTDDTLVIHFDEDEYLTVLLPKDIINEENEFSINDAKSVKWEWIPYGTPHAKRKSITYTMDEENQCYRQYDDHEPKIIKIEGKAVACLSY